MDQAGSVIPDNLLSTVRTVIQWVAAGLTSHGVLQGGQEQAFVGIAIGVVTLGWSFVANARKKSALKEAIAAPSGQATIR